MSIEELKDLISETKAKFGSAYALQAFCNYLSQNGHTEAGNLLVDLKRAIIKDMDEAECY